MIRIAVIVALLATAGATIARAEADNPISASDRQKIATVILSQMAAFRAENGEAAFAFSAPDVRAKFGSSDTFMKMIRDNYQPVYNPRSVRFGALSASPMGPVQHVFLLDPNAVAFVALYLMERGADGRWQIAGCTLFPREGREA